MKRKTIDKIKGNLPTLKEKWNGGNINKYDDIFTVSKNNCPYITNWLFLPSWLTYCENKNLIIFFIFVFWGSGNTPV